MSRTNEMASILVNWFSSIPANQVKNKLERIEARNAIHGKSSLAAVDALVNFHGLALELYVGYPSYLQVAYKGDDLYVSEMRYQSDQPGDVYHEIHAVKVEGPLEALINLKQRYEWEMSDGC